MNDQRTNPSVAAEWKTVHEIGAGDLVVRVQRKGDRRPLYSLEIGKRLEGEDIRLGRHCAARIEVGDGVARVGRGLLDAMKEAYDWIDGDASFYEDAYLAGAKDREDRGGQRHTGKTARTREKQKMRAG